MSVNDVPAFPHTEWTHFGEAMISTSAGMTLRDYFAANAMQGQHANPECGHLAVVDIAKVAYLQADAMLAVRGRQ